MTFNDIFKSSFLEEIGSFSILDMVIALALSFAMGLFINFIYRKTFRGVMFSKTFGVALMALTMITTLVILAVTSNVVLSLGMVGALSIVRFRTAVKDSRDTVYIFWAIITGICCGVGDYTVAAVGGAITFAVILVLGLIRSDNRILLIVRADRSRLPMIKAQVYKLFSGKALLRAENTTPETAELIYELTRSRMKKAENTEPDLAESIYRLENIEYVNFVMQNDEISN